MIAENLSVVGFCNVPWFLSHRFLNSGIIINLSLL